MEQGWNRNKCSYAWHRYDTTILWQMKCCGSHLTANCDQKLINCIVNIVSMLSTPPFPWGFKIKWKSKHLNLLENHLADWHSPHLHIFLIFDIWSIHNLIFVNSIFAIIWCLAKFDRTPQQCNWDQQHRSRRQMFTLHPALLTIVCIRSSLSGKYWCQFSLYCCDVFLGILQGRFLKT